MFDPDFAEDICPTCGGYDPDNAPGVAFRAFLEVLQAWTFAVWSNGPLDEALFDSAEVQRSYRGNVLVERRPVFPVG